MASNKLPKLGTKTKGQSTRSTGTAASMFGMLAGGLGNAHGAVHSAQTSIRAFTSDPDPATYETYRAIRSNPTVAIARAAMFAPIKAAQWTFEAKDGVPDDRVKFIQAQFEPMRAEILRDVMRAVEYGWQPFERVYTIKDNRVVCSRFKPLLPDVSSPILDKDTYRLIGVENNGTKLSMREAALFSYDSECDDPYGRSIYENIRVDAWWPWKDASVKLAQYATKGAGVIPLIRYPMGRTNDSGGTEVDNSVNASNVLRTLGVGMGVAMPNAIDPAYDDLLRGGANVQDLMAWQISFLETRSGVGGELIEAMRHYEKLIVRGMLQPERSLLEGEFGTKADAGSHTDTGLLIATELLEWVISEINRQFVDPLLAINFGFEARGSVYIKPSPIVDEDRAFMRELVKQALLADPALLMGVADFDAMLDAVNIPKSDEVVDTSTMQFVPGAPSTAPTVDVPGAVNDVMSNSTGDVVADTALNGAQVQSMVEVVAQVAANLLPPESAKGILKIAFPKSSDALVDRVINAAAAFTQQPAKPAPTPGMAALARNVKQFRRMGLV